MGKLIRMLAATGMLVRVALPVSAQYPVRPIRFIVPFPAGGGVDIVARALADKLTTRLGQSIVIRDANIKPE